MLYVVIWVGSSVLAGLLPGRQNPVIVSASKQFVSVVVYPSGAAAELFDGSLKLRLTRKTGPRYPVHARPDPGLPTPKRWKKLQPPESSGFRDEVGAEHAWNLHLEATDVGFFLAGQSSRRGPCSGTSLVF